MSYIPSPTQYQITELSSADILALFSTPKTLITSPGSGKCIVPTSILFQYTYGSATYVFGGSAQIKSGSALIGVATTVLTAVASANTLVPLAAFVLQANQPITLSSTVSNPITGDGTLKIHVWYQVANI